MRYFTQAVEDDLVASILDSPETCATFAERESYRDDGNIVVYRNHRSVFLHRLLYRRMIGALSRGEFLISECETRGCVNPFHRQKVFTPSARNQATHCPKGHEYDDSVRDSRGRRYCRPCARERKGYVGTGSPMSEELGKINRQKRFCPQGHEYTDENTYRWVDDNGSIHRSCKTCKALNRSTRKASS